MPSIGSLCVCSFYILIFLPYNCSPENWHFPAIKILCSPQFWTYRHRTGFIVKRKQVCITNYLGIPIKNFIFYKFLKFFFFFAPKKYTDFKKFPKIYYSFFFHKKWIGHTYICTKCNDDFKFTISLKLNGAKDFIAVPPNSCLFSITSFLYGWQKIFTNKNIFSKHDLHVLFI